uniref:BTB/POZ domain-containing protein 6 n=1 Tax=Cacopsylla melanoneura TaxID=428564 RepID=A0A8D8T6E4_9HEMI
MRNRKTKEKYKPDRSSSWIANPGVSGSNPSGDEIDFKSEIENLFNTYTLQNNIAMGSSGTNPLLDTEQTSDVTFLVGIEPDVWRIPGHRRLLADKNRVFEAMFYGALARSRTQDPVINITDVSGRAFDYFIKFLYNDDIDFLNVPSTLDILHVADKYLCTSLIKKCCFYLDQHLTADNVLDVYCNVQIYVGSTTHSSGFEDERHCLVPSAPQFDEVFEMSQRRRSSLRGAESTEENRMKAQYKSILELMQPGNDAPETINRILNILCYNCLLFIDSHAHQIFSSLQNVENVSSLQTLCQMFSRSTLQVSDEMILYKFLNAYLTNCLKQLQIPISCENKRQLLTNQNCDRILFTIKYLLIDPFDSFVNDVHESQKNNLFWPYELDFLLYLRQNSSHLYMIVQNLCNMPQTGANNNNSSCVDENLRNATKAADLSSPGSGSNSWESYNLSYIDVMYLNNPRTESNEAFLPLSLRSLPKLKPQDEAHAQEKIATCKSKEKRKFAEYVWTVLAFIFD